MQAHKAARIRRLIECSRTADSSPCGRELWFSVLYSCSLRRRQSPFLRPGQARTSCPGVERPLILQRSNSSGVVGDYAIAGCARRGDWPGCGSAGCHRLIAERVGRSGRTGTEADRQPDWRWKCADAACGRPHRPRCHQSLAAAHHTVRVLCT